MYKIYDYSKYLNIIIYNIFTFINILREVGWEAEGEFLIESLCLRLTVKKTE